MDIFPMLYPEFSVFLEIICATSTALPILIPRALMLTVGKLANWINVEVTYAIIGFLPMNTVSRCSVDMRVKYYEDNLNQDRMEKEEILKLLKNNDTKIDVLSELTKTNDPMIIQKVIELFDAEKIEVRGEVFSTLFLNENDILEQLIKGLKHKSKYVRGYVTLVLANRNEKNAVKKILELTNDPSGLVRTCVYGALGHLEVKEGAQELHKGIFDSNLEAVKSAAYALARIGEQISQKEIDQLEKLEEIDYKKILKFFK
jgi:HEAT repeat protein